MKKTPWIAVAAALSLAWTCGAATARTVTVVHVASYVAPLPVVVYPVVRADRQWVQGRWEWNGAGHVWVPGHWQLPPRAYSYAD